MAKGKGGAAGGGKRAIAAYDHKDKTRANNPPVGLVTPETDRDTGPKTYAYDPHLDPQLQWAGKAERLSFDVPTVSLHVHERIDPRTILEAVRKRHGNGPAVSEQPSLFETREANPPLREAIEFYKHPNGWTNRLVAGDSLLVMNSLLEKEGMAGKVQMVYMDPPYGIKYGSNFQPFVNKRDVKDGKDEDLTQEPEMIRAFRDTWELGIHSYLSYLRDRLLLCRELLSESGSCFVQISDENVHLVRNLMDEIFGLKNRAGIITFRKTSGLTAGLIAQNADYLLWYARDINIVKYRQLYLEKGVDSDLDFYSYVELPSGERRKILTKESMQDLPAGSRPYSVSDLTSSHEYSEGKVPFEFEGKKYNPGVRYWSTSPAGMERLKYADRIHPSSNSIRYVRYFTDFPFQPLTANWTDTITGQYSDPRLYVVQTAVKAIQRCLLMTTDPGDLVFDPTCGSGTTAYVAEQWGRRWITCDTSRVAVTLAKQRLMTALFDYYELAHPEEGVGSGFKYKTVPHVTLKSIANNPDIKPGMSKGAIDAAIARHAEQETLYDQPFLDKSKARVTGPFTVEAVPAPTVRPLGEFPAEAPAADASAGRSGESRRQDDWRSELLRCGIRGKGGQKIEFSRVEPLAGTRRLHADGETKDAERRRVVLSFGPVDAPLEQRQVAEALEEANLLVPKPKLVAFAAFHFDPEAAKDIDETNWPGVILLKVQMNTDLLTEDLKKKRASNDSFWMVGQPDVGIRRIERGEHAGLWEVEVYGFDYYNPKTGAIESGDTSKIAVWLLDPDYDGRSLYPRQVFFPMAGDKEGWARLAKNLKAEIDEDLIESYRGNVSLPFELGDHKRVAVKIVDDRGIESLKIVEIE